MSFENGSYKILSIDSGGGFFPIGCLTSNSFSEDVTMLDTTTRDNQDGWKSSRPTMQSYNISFDGLITQSLVSTTSLTYWEIKQIKRARQQINWKIEDSVGNIEKGSGYFTSLSDSAAIDEYTTFNGAIEGYGKPIEPISEIYDTYENRVITNGGEITSENCQLEFIKQLL